MGAEHPPSPSQDSPARWGAAFQGARGKPCGAAAPPSPPPPWGLGRRGGCGVAHSHGAAGWGRKGGPGLGVGERGPGFATVVLRPPASSWPPATHRSHGGGTDTSLPVTRFPLPGVTHGTPAGGGGAHGGCPKPWDSHSGLHEAVPAPEQEPGPGRHQRGPALGGLCCWGGDPASPLCSRAPSSSLGLPQPLPSAEPDPSPATLPPEMVAQCGVCPAVWPRPPQARCWGPAGGCPGLSALRFASCPRELLSSALPSSSSEMQIPPGWGEYFCFSLRPNLAPAGARCICARFNNENRNNAIY